jgi:hypothetical protein
MTFDWLEGPEPVAFQVTGTCSDHAHFELLASTVPQLRTVQSQSVSASPWRTFS